MNDITITLPRSQWEALLPGTDDDVAVWNRRVELAEEAVKGIRRQLGLALRQEQQQARGLEQQELA
jgi:hypothetical protein